MISECYLYEQCLCCVDMIHLIGLVVALHGKETVAGDFLVLDILEAGLAPQTELPFESSMFAASQVLFLLLMLLPCCKMCK